MFFEKFDLLNQYDIKKKLYLVSINSPEITEFNKYYQYVYKRVKDLDSSELSESFSDTLKQFFSEIRTTVEPYDKVLKKYNFNELGSFFTQLVNSDYEENTKIILSELADLIKRFRLGDICNQMREKFLYYQELYGGNNVVVTYYPSYDSQIEYSSVYNYFKNPTFYDDAFFLGTPNFYGDNTIFKAKRTFYLSYDIYRMSFSKKNILDFNSDDNNSIYRDVDVITIADEKTQKLENMIEEEEFENKVMRINIDYIKKHHSKSSEDTLVTRAKLVSFKSDNFTFFALKSKLNVLNKRTGAIDITNLSELNSYDWLVIRTSSDEEYLTNEARKEIGPNYDKYYDEVTKYKEELQFKVENEYYTLDRLRSALKDSGVEVRKQLLMQWIYGDTIAPRDYDKILQFLDYRESEVNLLSNYYRVIVSAKKNAGKKLSDITQKVIDSEGIDNIREHMYEKNLYEFSNEYGEYRIEEILFVDVESIDIEASDLYRIQSNENTYKSTYKNNYFD
ncbi:hypothetical protein JZO82_12550 [Vagococcus fluvialis]|uniref:hypothetical protein n=1 Tax=Vagococcus fluvialis TaxID=2738 RepID=UPI001A8D3C1E|nr:hypothetical protein [Vagococcus fluvialis]MBO0429997.1 hypothetical protein [Vagococcus fluvialis]